MLLQIPPLPSLGSLAAGGAGEMARSSINNPDEKSFIYLLIIMVCCFLSFTEPLKVLLRKNIGKKALSLPGIITGSSLYLAWAGITGFYTLGIPIAILTDKMNGYRIAPATVIFIIVALYLFIGAVVIGIASFIILFRGMAEHYRAKAEDSQNWEVLEYRGDNIFMDKSFRPQNKLSQWFYKKNKKRFFKRYSKYHQDRLWRIAEPQYCLRQGLKLLLLFNPVIAIPLICTSITFWINEWYHVYYKPQKMKDTFLEMKIEMEKSSMYFNQSDLSGKPSRVTIE